MIYLVNIFYNWHCDIISALYLMRSRANVKGHVICKNNVFDNANMLIILQWVKKSLIRGEQICGTRTLNMHTNICTLN